jgi:hypothetical protein
MKKKGPTKWQKSSMLCEAIARPSIMIEVSISFQTFSTNTCCSMKPSRAYAARSSKSSPLAFTGAWRVRCGVRGGERCVARVVKVVSVRENKRW